MHKLGLVVLLICLVGCKHPLGISGSGDVLERLAGERQCTLEAYQAQAPSCKDNQVHNSDYTVVYEAVPRPGWAFDRWAGTPCGPGSQGAFCQFDYPAGWVNLMDSGAAPAVVGATVAVFKQAPVNTVNLRGKVTYTRYPVDENGIDYSSPQILPVRGAVVEVRRGTTTVVAGNTSSSGDFSLQVPAEGAFNVVVLAALGHPNGPHTKVRAANANRSLYGINKQITLAGENLQIDLHADSGWRDGAYAAPRAAGPFAIIDTVYRAQQMMQAVDPGAQFPRIDLYWLTDIELLTDLPFNAPVIQGRADIDTDEYDTAVVAKLWARQFLRYQAEMDWGWQGSPYRRLEPEHTYFSQIFAGGFADALAAMIAGSPWRYDSHGKGQAQAYRSSVDKDHAPVGTFYYDGETPRDGYLSRQSIAELVYDLYDGGAEDDDNVALGFAPVYNALMHGVVKSGAFPSIFGFMHFVKQQVPGAAADITALGLLESIPPGDEYEAMDIVFYNEVPSDGSVIAYRNRNETLMSEVPYQARSRLSDTEYFRTYVPSTGCYVIKAKADGSASSLLVVARTPGVYLRGEPIALEQGEYSFYVRASGRFSLTITPTTTCN